MARIGVGLVVAALLQEPAPAPGTRLSRPLGLDVYMPVPEENPMTPEKVSLGRQLFYDPILSREGTLACSSCHDPRRAFTDGRPVAVGTSGQRGNRSAPTLVNRGYGRSFFWDGRAATLEAQVLEPIANSIELGLPINEAIDRLRTADLYRQAFDTAFGREATAGDLARALATYVRSIQSGNTPFDRYMNGDQDALSIQERAGLAIFRGKGNCASCHVGPTFTDEQFHNTGVAWQNGVLRDPGRFAVTRSDTDRGAFKTPTLREVARTAPYMHDGSFATLEDVIHFYDRGGNGNPHLDPELRPLSLTAVEKQSLAAFLRSLTGDIHEGAPAPAVPRARTTDSP